MNIDKRNQRDVERFWKKVPKLGNNECWECAHTKDKDGYGYLKFNTKATKAHRIAYCLANNLAINDIKGKFIRHTCDNPSCCNPNHLLLGTVRENVNDQIERDRIVHGIRHGNSKFSLDDIVLIFSLRNAGVSCKNIAEKFSCHPGSIHRIISGRYWIRTSQQLGLISE